MLTCKICHQDKKLIKCHILPEAIHKDTYEREALVVVKDAPPKRLQVGYYDNNLVCKDCEDKFHPYDDYFINFFRERYLKEDAEIRDKNGQVIAYKYINVQCDLLYGFFVFHLLRASLSEIDFYQSVNLGKKYNNLLINALLNDDPPLPIKGIELIFSTYNQKTRTQVPPVRSRSKHINGYDFILPHGIEISYKVDKRH